MFRTGTPLQYAASFGLFADLKYFLEQESTACVDIIKPNARTLQNNEGTIARARARGTALCESTLNGDCEMIQLFIDHHTDMNFRLRGGRNVLCDAVRGKHFQATKLLIEAGADVNLPEADGQEQLYLAVGRGYNRIVKLLELASPDVNILRSRCGTVFRGTGIPGKVSIVQLLIEHGVEINLQCRGFRTASGLTDGTNLQLADVIMIDEGCPSTSGLSIGDSCAQVGEGVTIPFTGPPTDLQTAAALGRGGIVQLLIDDSTSDTAYCRMRTIRLFLRHCGDFNRRGTQPAAVESGHNEMIELPLEQCDEDNFEGEHNLVVVTGGSIGIVDHMYHRPPEDEILLSAAAERGPVKIVQLLIYHPSHDIDVLPDDNDSFPNPRAHRKPRFGVYHPPALVRAVQNGNLEMTKLLLKNGANVKTSPDHGKSALSYAAIGGHLEILKLLLDHGADVNFSSEQDAPTLIYAAAGGNLKLVKLLLSHGADINILYKAVGTAVIGAAAPANQDFGLLFLTHLREARSSFKSTETALTQAIKYGHKDIVKLLLARGADMNAGTDLMTVPEQGDQGMSQLYLYPKGNPSATPALTQAAKYGHMDIVKLLLEHDVDINISSKSTETALIHAIGNQHPGIVKLLLAHGVDANMSSQLNETILVQAVEAGNQEIVELLLTYGAHVNLAGGDKQWNSSPLATAIHRGRLEILQLLIDNGVDVNKTDGKSGCPLARAIAIGDQSIVELLTKYGAVAPAQT